MNLVLGKYQVWKIALIAFILLIVLVFTLQARADNRPGYYANCTEAKAHHDTNIPKSSKFYRPELDRNHDGTACEE